MGKKWKVRGNLEHLGKSHLNGIYLTQECRVTCIGTQSQSKYYRVVDKWRLFTHLRSDCAKPESGIGWDEEHRYFLGGADQWIYLYQLNHQYVDFQHIHSADLMILWDEVMDHKQATGNQAQFSAQTPPQYVPPRIRRRRDYLNIKGKGVVLSSVINPPNFQGESDDNESPILRNPDNRPLDSATYGSDKEDLRGTKSRKSGSDNYQEVLSKFNRFFSIVSNERATKEKYSIEVAKKNCGKTEVREKTAYVSVERIVR